MLHLSLLHLPRLSPRWRHLDPYQAHQLVWKAFPGVPEGERPFLFSLDDRRTHYSLLVQSTIAPDWTGVEADARVRLKTFDPRVAEGTQLQFFLRCNPTVAERTSSGRGRRRPVGLGTDVPRKQALAAWLAQQARQGGFSVEAGSLQIGPSVRRVIARPRERQRSPRPIVLHEVEINGLLRVENAEAFAATRKGGIGRGRSFGYGLLMVKAAG